MSEFAYFRVPSLKLLTREEEQHKDEMISATEQVLASKGIECDQECAKMSEEQTVKILEQVRRLRAKKKKRILDEEDGSIGELEEDEQHDEKEAVYGEQDKKRASAIIFQNGQFCHWV
jgi:hypothetical protein